MGNYFKVIGVIEIIGWICGFVPLIIYCVNAMNSNGPYAILINLLIIVLYFLFGPAFGLGFYYLGCLVCDSKNRK